ncbi:DUF1015 family protein [Kineococcus sp. SYSU DK018]|uniref:DUF1015 family protein n=1 Tax=Kineococcus sp. SYSU DK018 TaxID=3383139 RepID=UPI003D7DA97E
MRRVEPARTGARAQEAVSTSTARVPGPGDLLRPFPGLRYRQEVVGPLRNVLAPPHTETGRTAREAAMRSAPHLVTHLERPEYAPQGEDGGPTVLTWLHSGVLLQDPPALYVLQQRTGGLSHRFLVGELRVTGAADDRVRAHEATMEHAVRTRIRRLEATAVDSEPVLLVDAGPVVAEDLNGTSFLTRLVRAAVQSADHVISTPGPGGTDIDLWRVTEGDAIARLSWAVGGRRWIIGDGHHRHEAARRLARQSPGVTGVLTAMSLPGDAALEVSALHRVVPRGAGRHLLDAGNRQRRNGGTSEAALADLASLSEPDCLVVEDSAVTHLRTAGRTATAVGVAAWVDEILMLGGVPDQVVDYVRDPRAALARGIDGSTAVLLPAPDFEHVVTVTSEGGLLGRKATSFNPKPVAGAVLRLR